MLGKRQITRPVAPVRKRRKGEPPIEEITFDFDAREDYLTGFHKRKLQRIKHAKEEASKKERVEKITARKALRENRKVEQEKQIEAINAAVKNARHLDEGYESSEGQGEQWSGIGESTNVDHEENYLDEDRHTVVTVEAVDVSHEGLQRRQETSESEDDPTTQNDSNAIFENSTNEASIARHRINQKPGQPPASRSKKKKFRYETKADRKKTRFKEKIGSKAKAKARRG
ncbi:MAG: hypothetical protein Q9219_005122 [cf. Caloplaca sp. 3 TL-2023]